MGRDFFGNGTFLVLIFGFLALGTITIASGIIRCEGRQQSLEADHFDSSSKIDFEREQENLSIPQREKRETGSPPPPSLFRAVCPKCLTPEFELRENALHSETFTDSENVVCCWKCRTPVLLHIRCAHCKENYLQMGSSKLAGGSGVPRVCRQCQLQNAAP